MKKNNYFYFLIFLFLNLFFLSVKADPVLELGKTIFLEQGNCATCHTLADAKSNGEIGPNLNQIKPDIIRVISTVTNGIGVMPPYKDLLSKEEIEAVAHYVSLTAAE